MPSFPYHPNSRHRHDADLFRWDHHAALWMGRCRLCAAYFPVRPRIARRLEEAAIERARRTPPPP